jgi:ABC-2 type transport system ATP-binding protein
MSASIAKGEVVGLLGLNGAGKTTTLRILACDLLPSSGTVCVDGIDVVERPDDVRKLIGYLPEHPPLYEEMTVHEFLVFAGRLRGLSLADAERRAREVEDTTHVAHVSDDAIATLSHGYRQRVGMAQAIVHRPRLVLLDEPNTGLDPVQIVEMRQLVRGLRREHTTIISSHILSEISETCDRILVVGDGKIVASGTEAELSSRLTESKRIVVTVRGDAAQARRLCASVAGVETVEIAMAQEPGAGLAALRIGATRDVREDLCRTLVLANIGILEVVRSERELESIFLRLAQGAPAVAAASPQPKTAASVPPGGAP